jgi:hypothetical protein
MLTGRLLLLTNTADTRRNRSLYLLLFCYCRQKDSNGYDVCISAMQQPTIQSTGYYTHVGSHLVFVDGSCPCGNGKGFWTCANCDSYTQQRAFSDPRIARQVKGMVAEINCKPIFLELESVYYRSSYYITF